MPTLPDQLDSAFQILQSGQDVLARQAFLEIVREDPQCATAWAYLSELFRKPDNQITALENLLQILPPDTVEQVAGRSRLAYEIRLAELYQANPQLQHNRLDPATREALEFKLEQARNLAGGGLESEAIRLAEEVAQANPFEERAWHMLSALHPQRTRQIEALKHIVEINPQNEKARRRLSELTKMQKNPLQRGSYLEERGQFDKAIEVYKSVIALSRSVTERVEAQNRIKRIQLLQEAHQIQPVNPTLNMLRLTTGPALVFALMVFMQSGFKLPHISLLACPGLLCVLAGSLVISATDLRPIHPLWVKFFGKPGSGDEPEMRHGLRLLGFALMLAPFTMFLIEAGYRLGVLQASMISRFR